MWKKDEGTTENRSPADAPTGSTETPRRTSTSGERASIGRSIRIQGDVSGDEDLLIQGHVKGSVTLEQNAVTVGSEGEVHASIQARLVTVEGRVVGDLIAEERVILRSSARVEGDITSPRVVLEDGANFRGGIDMGERPGASKSTSQTSTSAGSRAPRSPATGNGGGEGKGSGQKEPAGSGSGKASS
jgi:cytoskeletal protein CcmA (bactofilin family)